MAGKRHFRSREASLWQSAADKVISTTNTGAALLEPADPQTPEMAAVNSIASAVNAGSAVPRPEDSLDARTLSVTDSAKFCAAAAFQLARAKAKQALTGDDSDVKKFNEELGAQFGTCDIRWSECVAEYLKMKAAGGAIPYRRYANLSDYIMEDPLPDTARIAIVGDWGTGDSTAKLVLNQIAQKHPDVVIHLGDVYYSGTDHEFQNYFYSIWQNIFGLPAVSWGEKPAGIAKPATFILAGNHDMYAGGKPYYAAIDMLGQPASYFCLRNQKWQFIAMDTGLHDNDPTKTSVTFLEDSEVAWVHDKMQTANGRKTVLLSHHQLFTTFEDIGGAKINATLQTQLRDILPQVTVWYWGHEHDFVVYPKFMNVLGRCLGHGAVPVGFNQIGSADASVPFEPVRLSVDADGGLFQHGYAIMDLNGAAATVKHYMFDPVSQAEEVLFTETFAA
jgi:3',5'-cyclic AMP phosphodiesterase CpdA